MGTRSRVCRRHRCICERQCSSWHDAHTSSGTASTTSQNNCAASSIDRVRPCRCLARPSTMLGRGPSSSESLARPYAPPCPTYCCVRAPAWCTIGCMAEATVPALRCGATVTARNRNLRVRQVAAWQRQSLLDWHQTFQSAINTLRAFEHARPATGWTSRV
jgi:hypothetical protein